MAELTTQNSFPRQGVRCNNLCFRLNSFSKKIQTIIIFIGRTQTSFHKCELGQAGAKEAALWKIHTVVGDEPRAIKINSQHRVIDTYSNPVRILRYLILLEC